MPCDVGWKTFLVHTCQNFYEVSGILQNLLTIIAIEQESLTHSVGQLK